MSQISHVTCHVSRVKCHVSHVTKEEKKERKKYKVVKLVSGGSVINGATPSSFECYNEIKGETKKRKLKIHIKTLSVDPWLFKFYCLDKL